ncbi:MAG: HlyD family efflux transporter periplasmic adaptor subunit [Pseudomonadota bacterium]
MFGRALIFIFVLLAGGVWVLNQISRQFFAYTSDAYVLSDFVTLAPTVAGKLVEVYVSDNQAVAEGDVLFEIDPRPYGFDVDAAQASLDRAQVALTSANQALDEANDQVKASQAVLTDARDTQARIAQLEADGVATVQRLEDVNRNLADAQADFRTRQAAAIVAADTVANRRAGIASAEADLGLAQYNLEETKIRAPFPGFVAPFTIREGTYLTIGDPVMAVVDNEAWRIVANLPEEHLSHVAVGQPVWLSVASKPWRVYSGRVLNIPRGISRSASPADPLPYVEPTTAWIRLSRRFPVEISLDDPAEVPLFMGANARVFIRHVGPAADADTTGDAPGAEGPGDADGAQ